MEELFSLLKVIFEKIPPSEVLNILIFAGIFYAFYIVFSRLTKMMDDRAKVSEQHNRSLLEINKRFDTYVNEHQHLHNQVDNRLNHMNSELVEIRKDTTSVRDSQIRIEAKVDVLVEDRLRRKGEKN